MSATGRRTGVAVLLGRGAASLSRVLGRGSGEVVGGTITMTLAPRALGDLAHGRLTACVSGTNGKTTTTRLLAAALATRYPQVASNGGGANMTAGILTALAVTPRAPAAALEVDEMYLPHVAPVLAPRAVTLLNITRDQLDRSNETRRIATLWRQLGAELPDTVAVANVDDPLVTWAALGFSRQVWVSAGQSWLLDGLVCPACGSLLHRSPHDWSCAGCGLRRPAAELTVTAAGEISTGSGEQLTVALPLPGRVNTGNAAMAAATAREFGVTLPAALAATESVADVEGRYRTVRFAGRTARLLLAKNPAGWQEMLDLLDAAPVRPVVIAFNARVADGRDPSWLYDVPVERLLGRPVHVCGDRAADLSLRLAYAGVNHRVHPDAAAAVAATDPDHPMVDLLATYTAFRDVRRELARSGGARR